MSRSANAGVVREVVRLAPSEARRPWRWKVRTALLGNTRERERAGDDYAARVFIIFEISLLPLRTRAINYVWAALVDAGNAAGPIGCEMAQCFACFGSEVQLIETTAGILPREDHDAAKIVQASLLRTGVKLPAHAKDPRLTTVPEGVALHLTSDGAAHTIVADRLLVAVGRAPNVEHLGLEAALSDA